MVRGQCLGLAVGVESLDLSCIRGWFSGRAQISDQGWGRGQVAGRGWVFG